MPNLLGLDGWKTLPRKENDHDIVIPAEYNDTPTVCVRCGVVDPALKRHGVQRQTFMDTPIHGKRAGIVVKRQRYKCLECEKTFFQSLPDLLELFDASH